MDKRYQVFVSSTYADLKDERQHVLQALMEMDCIPAGMELFPAADEEQWEFIKKIIDDCDYYLLIIGGRYGSVTSDGISYTEKEFDYAVEKNLKIVALIHGSPEDIPFGKSEQNPVLREKLLSFKSKVMDGRLIKYWDNAKDLPGLVALSLTKTIKMYPAIGWVRANNVANEDILKEINEVRKKNVQLQDELSLIKVSETPITKDISDFDSLFTIHYKYKYTSRSTNYSTLYEYTISWRKLFSLIAPYLTEHPSEAIVDHRIALTLKELHKGNTDGYSFTINEQELKTIGIQLKAYRLVQISYSKTTKGGYALFWSLTPEGEKVMLENRIIRNEN